MKHYLVLCRFVLISTPTRWVKVESGGESEQSHKRVPSQRIDDHSPTSELDPDWTRIRAGTRSDFFQMRFTNIFRDLFSSLTKMKLAVLIQQANSSAGLLTFLGDPAQLAVSPATSSPS